MGDGKELSESGEKGSGGDESKGVCMVTWYFCVLTKNNSNNVKTVLKRYELQDGWSEKESSFF